MQKLKAVAMALGIFVFGYIVDQTLVSLFSRSYWELPREQFFFLGFPVLALICSAVFYRQKREVLGLALLIAGLGPVIGIGVWLLLWGAIQYSVAIFLMITAVVVCWKKYFMIRDH